jgi:hypothetical protein
MSKVGPSYCFYEILEHLYSRMDRDSSTGIGTGYALDGRASITGKGQEFFFSAQHPHQLWVPLGLLSNG